MTRWAWAGIGAAILVAVGVASRALGSRPEAPAGGPLEACGSNPNCARVRVSLSAPAHAVRAAARQALGETGAAAIEATDAGWTAMASVSFFTDDVSVAVESDGAGSILWVRSASRVGRSDLGVNARRVRRLAEATARLV